jgi:hypothetical protein
LSLFTAFFWIIITGSWRMEEELMYDDEPEDPRSSFLMLESERPLDGAGQLHSNVQKLPHQLEAHGVTLEPRQTHESHLPRSERFSTRSALPQIQEQPELEQPPPQYMPRPR